MRWFVEAVDGEIHQVRDVDRVIYHNDDYEVELKFASGVTARCDVDEWEAVKGGRTVVPATPGVRVVYALPGQSDISLGQHVIAWRIDVANAHLVAMTIDDMGGFHSDVAFQFPDGHVESEDGYFESIDIFREHFKARKARREAEARKKRDAAMPTPDPE